MKKSKVHPNNSLKKTTDHSTFLKVIQNWRIFSDITKLAGVRLIGGRQHLTKCDRLFLLSVWLTCLCLGIYKSVQCVNIYFQYDVKTIITFNSVNEQPFPAVTMCNVNAFRKSVIGLDSLLITAATHLTTGDYKSGSSFKENVKACALNDTDLMDHSILEAFLNGNYEMFWKSVASDSTISVEKCWWNKQELNCSNNFVNHQFDDSVCFTFNQDQAFIELAKGSMALAIYGMETKKFSQKSVATPGLSTGFQVLLNVHAEEYCLRGTEDYGLGFRTLVHDTNSHASFNLDPSFTLGPGYEYLVTLRPIIYDLRNYSEWLGKCTHYVYSFLNPNDTKYNRELCFMSCLVEIIWHNCNCLIVEKSSNLYHLESTALYLGTETSLLKSCDYADTNQQECISKYFVDYIKLNPDEYCPICKRKCLETKYEFVITAKKLSYQKLKTLLPNSSMPNESLRKNYLLVSFVFNEMTSQSVREIQAFTSLQLYMYIGGTLGLFLGSSTISFYEIIHHLFLTVSIFLKSPSGKKKRETSNIIFANAQSRNQTRFK